MVDLVNIDITGSGYQVPASLTIMQALEYAGYHLVRGGGCRRGSCGACATVYRIRGDYRLHCALACQTPAEEGMYLSTIPFFPANEMIYHIDDLEPTAGQILEVYPDAITCMGCNTCTRSCPQGIDVLACMADALQGNIRQAASRSLPCVQCRLCNVRCPADLSPCNIALLCRRLYGRHVAPPDGLLRARIEEIQTGVFAEELARLMGGSIEELRARYEQRELELEL